MGGVVVVVICCGTTEKSSSSVPTLAVLASDSEGIVVRVVGCGMTEKLSSSVPTLAVLEGSTDFGSDGVMVLKGSTEVDSDGMFVVVCCGTTEKPSSSVPTLVVLAGLPEIGCDVVVGAGTTDVNPEDVVGKRESLPPSFDFSSKARRILELCFFAFLSSLDTLAILRESELSSVDEIRLLAARRALLSMPSIENGDDITMV